MNKYPSTFKTVRFQDCDPLSHLNNGMYFDYFMNSREDHLLEFYGLNVYDRLNKEGKSWVVAKSEIVYKYPAYLMEKVLIKTQVNAFSLKHIEVEMSMYDELDSKLKALLKTIFIPFDVTSGKSITHDAEIMDLLKNVLVEDVNQNIDERAIELQASLK